MRKKTEMFAENRANGRFPSFSERETGLKRFDNCVRGAAAFLLLAVLVVLLIGKAGSAHAAETEAETSAETGTEANVVEQVLAGAERLAQTEMAVEKEPEHTTDAESEEDTEPEGLYVVRIVHARVVLPTSGRIYDGTDQIDVAFATEIVRAGEKEVSEEAEKETGKETERGMTGESVEGTDAKEGKVPHYQVTCQAHLAGADAGAQRVICTFTLDTHWPDHVRLDASTLQPDLTVQVLPARLRVEIADGTKAYMDPADIAHITFTREQPVTVTGFVQDADGGELVPEGFQLPEIAVDAEVLQADSPAFEPDGEAQAAGAGGKENEDGSGVKGRRKVYRDAVILKRHADGSLTGNPTANYVFCSTEEDPDYVRGSVTVTDAAVQPERDFTVFGEEGAFLWTQDGGLVLRSGTGLRVLPASGSGYTDGVQERSLTRSGSLTFRLTRRDASGFVLARSQEVTIPYTVDGSAPLAVVTTDAGRESGGVHFSNGAVSWQATVPEDDLSGIRLSRCRLLRAELTAEHVSSPGAEGTDRTPLAWQEVGRAGTVTASEEGIYVVEAEVTDGVGNVSRGISAPVVLDRTAPALTVSGAEEGGAYAGAVALRISCADPTYQAGSLRAELKAAFDGVQPQLQEERQEADGAVLVFEDIPHRRKADAVYTLTVTARDRAGNGNMLVRTFSVNRFGSSYSLSEETAAALASYYHRSPFPVTFVEINPDRVPSARVLLRREGTLRELKAGEEFLVQEERTRKGAVRCTYTVPSEQFAQNGRYEVMLLTTDRAGNRTDSTAQELPVRFAVDAEAPQCRITGFEPGACYRLAHLTAVVEVRDNLAPAGAQVYTDAALTARISEEELRRADGAVKITLSEKKAWQTVQVRAFDMAGNETWSEEVPVYVSASGPWPDGGYRVRRLSAQQLAAATAWIEALWRRLGGSPDTSLQSAVRTFTFRTDSGKEESGAKTMRMKSRISGQSIRSILVFVTISLLLSGFLLYFFIQRRMIKKKYG